MNVRRFVHIRPLVKRNRKQVVYEKGGATVCIESTERLGYVTVGIVMCSKSDNFVKKIGRDLSNDNAIKQETPLRYLGGILSQVAEEVEGSINLPTAATDYNWAMKHFLPKD